LTSIYGFSLPQTPEIAGARLNYFTSEASTLPDASAWPQGIPTDLEGTHFVGIGMLHVLGPDGIPRQLQRLKLVVPSDLHENPALEM
jgi:hypothetical protein